jgi:Bacterial Ig-like domain
MAPRGRGRSGGNGNAGSLPPSWLGAWFDPELEALFSDDPELARTAQLLRAARPEPQADPAFQRRLRTSLMEEAVRTRARRRNWFFSPSHLAWAGVAVGVAGIAATAVTLVNGPRADHQTLVALSNVGAQHSVSPDDVITVSFNQPMDEQAVVAGLHIQPATKVTTTWRANDLLITPVHHLTGNTPYTVTIAKSAARTASGVTAHAAIHITFGTAPAAPASSPLKPPALDLTTSGPASPGAAILLAPDGAVIVTSAAAPALAAASSTPSAAPSGSPSATGAASGESAMLEYPADGGAPVTLGPSARAAAVSPNGELLAAAVADATGGGTRLLVLRVSGGSQATLAQTGTTITSLAWSTNREVLYATAANEIRSVDLSGISRPLAQPQGPAAVQLAPRGGYAYLAPSSGSSGQLLDLASGAVTTLDAGQSVAFSADGSTVAWVDRSQRVPRLETQLLGSAATVPISVLDPSGSVSLLALNASGSEAAYVEQSASGARRAVIASLPSGAPLAVGPAATALTLSADGRSVALLGGADSAPVVQRAAVPGVATPAQSGGVPAAARTALAAFVDAQVHGDTATLTSLSTPDADAVLQTPTGLTRGYVISAAVAGDGSVVATAELIVDPTGSHPRASTADETLTLSAGTGASYLVTSVQSRQLRDENPGPHVVRVSTTLQHGAVVVQISFDSDLDRSTVGSAIGLVGADGRRLIAPVSYDAESRTATITLGSTPPQGPLTVSVSPTLRDVDGQQLVNAFSTRTGF